MGHGDPVDDRRRLIDVNHAFYRALEDLDIKAMDEVWFHDPSVRCVHPGWDVLVGWEQVRNSFQQIFAGTRWIRVIPTALQAIVIGDAGIVTCTENITATQDDDVGVAVAQATNIFRRTPGGWRMMLHHASPSPVSVTEAFSGTVQ